MFLKNRCQIWVPWPQLPVNWHQALPIWLMQWPWPPNSYLLWGHCMFEVGDILKALEQELLYLILWLVTRSMYDQSKTLSHCVVIQLFGVEISVNWEIIELLTWQQTEKLFCGRIGYIWLVKIITTIRQVKASESKDKLGAMTPSRAQEKIGKY